MCFSSTYGSYYTAHPGLGQQPLLPMPSILQQALQINLTDLFRWMNWASHFIILRWIALTIGINSYSFWKTRFAA